MGTYERETGRRRATRRQRTLRMVGILVMIPVVLLGGSFLIESALEARDARRYPPPGQLVDVGGYRLHLGVTGVDTGQPTVLLAHGAGSTSAQWGWVQQQLASVTRVVAYDRPGMGYSDAPPAPLGAEEMLTDLHEALDTAGVPGPYVVVGHSMGAVSSLAFAETFADEVVGAVLVDPLTTDNPTFVRQVLQVEPIPPSPALAQLARFGMFRLLDRQGQFVGQLPPDSAVRLRAAQAAYHTNAATVPDLELSDRLAAVAAPAIGLKDKPVVVLSAQNADQGFTAPDRQRFTTLNQQVAKKLSSRGEHRVVPNCDHYSSVMSQPGASVVVAAITDVLGA